MMTSVSVVENKAPVSLRTCGSSNTTLANRRIRLQSFSPDKRAAAYKARAPDVGGPISVSPRHQGLEGTLLVSSPAESPIPQASITPYSGKKSRIACTEISSSLEWVDDFTDDDISDGPDTEDYETADKQKLLIVGCRSKIREKFEVPNIGEAHDLLEAHEVIFPVNSNISVSGIDANLSVTGIDANLSVTDFDAKISDRDERELMSSPDNPPPSPIDFRSSFDGFVVGGKKLVAPVTSKISQGNSCNHRDFVPGFVKHPLQLCKCKSRVIEEEQSEVALQRRRSFVLNNRISSHNFCHPDVSIPSEKSRLGRDSHVPLESTHSMYPCVMSPDGYCVMSPDGYHDKTFIETYLEKKKIKEEADRILEEQKKRTRERKRNKENMGKKAKEVQWSKTNEKGGNSKQELSVEIITRSSSNILESASMLNRLKCMACYSSETVKGPESFPVKSTSKSMESEKLQMRRCWSDIWPFPCNEEFKRQSEDDLFSYNFGNFRSKSRITPFMPLMRPPTTPYAYNRAESKIHPVTNVDSLPVEVTNDVIKMLPQTPATDTTMTATIMVPPRDAPCNQWVSFSSENEPVLNNAPDVDDYYDTFLKRMQRTQVLSNYDPSQPSGQFCFEAVVDKRYNRWKRRRRRKKEGEHVRAVRPAESESSDDDDDKNPVVEHILDRMYDQIHGPPPLTPNGTRDTPRLRNRRRRKEEELHTSSTSDAGVTNYDASSEWTSSDKDGGQLSSSNSGLMLYVGSPNNDGMCKPTEVKSSEDLCCWPHLEQYKQEMLKNIRNTPEDQLEEMDQKDWLPDITSKGQRSEHEDNELNDSNYKILEHFTALRTRDRSYSTVEASSSTCKKRSKLNQQTLRNPYSSNQRPKVLSNKEASSWSELGTRQRSARKIGLVATGKNNLGNSFKAALRPIKREDLTISTQLKPTRKPSKEQPKVKTYNNNLPTLTKNQKQQTILQNDRRDDNNAAKGRKKLQTPTFAKSGITKQNLSRPNTQPTSVRNQYREEHVDPNLIARDHYLKSLYNDRLRINSHNVGPGKQLKKAITVDQLDLSQRKKQTDKDKFSDLAFTRSFTFSMFDLPEVYKLYNSSVKRKANCEYE